MRRHACFWIGPVLFVLLFAALIVLISCSDKSSGPEQIPAAKIASISPERGPVQTRVEIRGKDFGEEIGSILFQDKAPYVALWSDSLIKADVPKQITSPCYVHISSKESDEKDSIYFIVEAMQIESIVPDHGLPGYQVMISGSGFGSEAGIVLFDSLEAYILSWDTDQIIVKVPENATSCNIEIRSQGMVSNLHGFAIDRMTITKIIPNRAIPGTEIEIHGYKFGDVQGYVKFQDANGEIKSWSDTLIITEVPYNANPGDLVIEVGGATSNSLSFQVEELHIREIIPDSATYDEQIEIHGSFYGAEMITVFFDDIETQPIEFNDTLILTTVPPGVDSSEIIVIANDLESNSVFFKVLHMTITSVEPDSGIVGQKIAIHGRYFGNTPGSVYFGDIEAAIDSWTDTLIYTWIPENAGSSGLIVSNTYESSNSIFIKVIPVENLMQILMQTNYVEVTFSGFNGREKTIYEMDYLVYCDTTYQLRTYGTANEYEQWPLNWVYNNVSLEYSYVIDDIYPGESSTISFSIEVWFSQDGNRIDSLLTSRSYYWSGGIFDRSRSSTVINIKNMEMDSVSLSPLSIFYTVTGADVINYIVNISNAHSESMGMDLPEERHTRYIGTDWENEEYPPELRVVFRQR